MTTAQVVETSVTVNNNSPIQDYVHPNDQTQPTFEMTPGFKPFKTCLLVIKKKNWATIFNFNFCVTEKLRKIVMLSFQALSENLFLFFFQSL